jgi:hypothetical protein
VRRLADEPVVNVYDTGAARSASPVVTDTVPKHDAEDHRDPDQPQRGRDLPQPARAAQWWLLSSHDIIGLPALSSACGEGYVPRWHQ